LNSATWYIFPRKKKKCIGLFVLALRLLPEVLSDISLKDHRMRRRMLLLLMIVLLITGSATGVRASTDCQRWFIAYKKQLLQSQTAKRIHAAKLRARRYARMKLAGYVKPKPVARPHHHRRPRRPTMTRAELLRRLDLACGILPERESDQPIISEEIPREFSSHPLLEDDILPVSDSDGGQLAYVIPPQLPLTGQDYNYPRPPINWPPTGGFPGFPVFPPIVPPTPPGPPVTPVPEPENIVLLLTGLIGAAGVVRRRIKS
jgi:hypothetical protein